MARYNACDEINKEISSMIEYVPEVAKYFHVIDKIGEGTFSRVFRAVSKCGPIQQEYALKYVIPTSKPSRIASEVAFLKELGGTSNIIQVNFCLTNNGHVVIVMPYFKHQRFSEYCRLMDATEARDYMRCLLVALYKVHTHGIIHRDIKPNNFLYNSVQKRYGLVDFGLAQRMSDLEKARHTMARYLPDPVVRVNKPSATITSEEQISVTPESPFKNPNDIESLNRRKKVEEMPSSASGSTMQNLHVRREPSRKIKECECFNTPSVCKICMSRNPEEAPRGGTPGFRAPEVLLKYTNQTTAIDIWSAGVIFMSILSKKYPFFRADDDLTALAEITFLVGTSEMKQAADALGKVLLMNLPEATECISGMRRDNRPVHFLQALCLLIQQEQPCYIHSHVRENEARTHCTGCHKICKSFPLSAFDLANRMLDPNPHTRITAEEALHHPFIKAMPYYNF